MVSKYDSSYCDKLIQHMAKGNCFKSFAGEIGVGVRTLYDWTKKHDEFEEAREIGRAKSLSVWTDIGRDLALGERKGNAVAWIFMMKNLFGWHDNRDPDKGEEKHRPINIQIVRDDSKL